METRENGLKKSVTRQIAQNYLAILAILLGWVIVIIISNVDSIEMMTRLEEYEIFHEYTLSATASFGDARENLSAMLAHYFYDDDVYRNAQARIRETTATLGELRVRAVRHGLSELVRDIDEAVRLVGLYDDYISTLYQSDREKLALVDLFHEGAAAFEEALYAWAAAGLTAGEAGVFAEISRLFMRTRLAFADMVFFEDVEQGNAVLANMAGIIELLSGYAPNAAAQSRVFIDEMISITESAVDAPAAIRALSAQDAQVIDLIEGGIDGIVEALYAVSATSSRIIDEILAGAIRQRTVMTIAVITGSFIVLAVMIPWVAVKLRRISWALRTAAEALRHSVGNVHGAAGELELAAATLAANNSEADSALQETSSATHESFSIARQNTDNLKSATDLTHTAGGLMQEAVQRSASLVEGMDELNASSEEINKIVGTITSISSQTNILALNASVEAMRAGDAGRSFGVVATEVRELAQQSSQAATDTEDIIARNVQRTKRSIEDSSVVSDVLSKAGQTEAEVVRLLDDIANASVEQTRGIEAVDKALAEMVNMLHSNASISDQADAAAHELKAQADHLLEVCREIEMLASGRGK